MDLDGSLPRCSLLTALSSSRATCCYCAPVPPFGLESDQLKTVFNYIYGWCWETGTQFTFLCFIPVHVHDMHAAHAIDNLGAGTTRTVVENGWLLCPARHGTPPHLGSAADRVDVAVVGCERGQGRQTPSKRLQHKSLTVTTAPVHTRTCAVLTVLRCTVASWRTRRPQRPP